MAKESVFPEILNKKIGEGSFSQIAKSMKFQFAATLSAWALFTFFFLVYVIRILAQLDIAFFESNGMISNPELREAFLYEIFNLEWQFYAVAFGGMFSVGIISYIFTRSQLNYFEELNTAMRTFAETGVPPDSKKLGTFSPHVQGFFKIISMKLKGEEQAKINTSLEMIDAVWPRKPQVSFADQGQFGVVAAVIAVIFSATGISFFIHVSERVVALSNQLIRFKAVTGPQYFTIKHDLTEMIIWPVFFIATILFISTGMRLGRKMSDATYAILRDLRIFMAKDINQKLFLRRGDPGQELIEEMNQSLDKIRRKINVR